MSRRNQIVCIFLAIFGITITLELCDAAARLIRVPLLRSITHQAGQFGQPVINYYTQLQVGTPPVGFNVQFDLGAQEHFVPHYSWNQSNRYLRYSTGFQCKSSSTCTKDNRQVTIEYQNCQLRGKRYEDLMTLVNAHQSNTTHPMGAIHWIQKFLAISSASDGRFGDLPIDGFFGLAPAPQSLAALKNILVSLHDNKLLDNLQFSLWLNPVLDSPRGGELILGGIDTNLYQGQIFWHHLENSNYNQWMLNLQYVTIGNQYVSCAGPAPSNCRVKFSSGLSDIYGPQEDVSNIYNMLNTSHQPSGLGLIDCRRINQLPVITFFIDGVPYALLPSNYIRKTIDGGVFKTEICYVAILPSSESREWTLGLNFLNAYYSIFDMTYRQIGFAAMR